ncbi:MAG: DMT family transporter [Pseudorhodoplanes sp.]|uniref:DMT family transporter n=1 Tax=Pseudorhodoplanes sp. TaxID=1934341 RepID=UPI003D0CAC98
MTARTILLTAIAMLCFAANSLLCRLALAPDLIDPASFSSVRVASACAMLIVAVWIKIRRLPRLRNAKLRSIAALFGYLVFFSFAYVRLDAGSGALILFGAVQLTMFGIALREGEPFPSLAWLGLAIAVAGLVWLLLPGASAPDPLGAVLMALSGMCWGLFSLLARGSGDPVENNATNFLGCLIPALLLNLAFAGEMHASPHGLALAIASGAVASGLGYVIWYLALEKLPATRAATVQLSVPAIAAIGGVIFLSEPVTVRLLVASAAMLGGIAIVLAQRSRAPAATRTASR